MNDSIVGGPVGSGNTGTLLKKVGMTRENPIPAICQHY